MSHNRTPSTIKRSNLSTIESSVTRLLVATKHLLESLTQWAKGIASEANVSDAYVQLGNEFKVTCRAFNNVSVDVNDLGDVPHSLRVVLEQALSEQPSQQSLDRFLPKIREIIVTLLQNLKTKQALVKESQSNRNQRSVSSPADYPGSSKESPKDALSRLQKGDSLTRRASKRFSAYQYSKIANISEKNAPRTPPSLDYLPPKDFVSQPISQPANLVSVFLSLFDKVKKTEVATPISIASIRLLFVEKFAYSPGPSSFPEVYVKLPGEPVSYELEETHLPHIVRNTQFSLKLDSKKDQFEEFQQNLVNLAEQLTATRETLLSEIQQTRGSPAARNESLVSNVDVDTKELAALRLQLEALQRSSATDEKKLTSTISDLSLQIEDLKKNTSGNNSQRVYMRSCHEKLSTECEALLTKADDLQDVIEALRKDVAQRRSRPSKRQIANVAKEIHDTRTELDGIENYIKEEKAKWKKIWEMELNNVCEEQQFFTLQEELIQDLDQDLDRALETFSLVEECSDQFSKNPSMKNTPNLPFLEPGESVEDLRTAVLTQVSALNPNHESRLEAIERAEKLRLKERTMLTSDEFEEELSDFVETKRFNSSGGIEEVDRLRKLRDEENLRSGFSSMESL